MSLVMFNPSASAQRFLAERAYGITLPKGDPAQGAGAGERLEMGDCKNDGSALSYHAHMGAGG